MFVYELISVLNLSCILKYYVALLLVLFYTLKHVLNVFPLPSMLVSSMDQNQTTRELVQVRP